MKGIICAKLCPLCQVFLEPRFVKMAHTPKAKSRKYITVWRHPDWSHQQKELCKMLMREVY
jgi:hypothetical protein